MNAVHIRQTGFGHIAAVAVIAVVAVVGFAGYAVVHKPTATAPVSSAAAAADATMPTSIKTTADLTQTSKALDSSAVQADSSLDDGSLDADVDALL